MATALGLRAAAMVGIRRRQEEDPMKRPRLSRWVAVLALVIAPVATPVTAEETATLTITGTFTGPSGGGTWTLTMYGTTHSHSGSEFEIGDSIDSYRVTRVYATSFDLEFAGPDADALNGAVGAALAGGKVRLYLRNVYQNLSEDFATFELLVVPPDRDEWGAYFWAGHAYYSSSSTLFPADEDGYPVVTSEPFSLVCEETFLYDGGWVFLASYDDTVTIAGDMGSTLPPPPPPPVEATLSIGDASVLEGDRGSTKLVLVVALASARGKTVTVDYRTVDGTAVSGTGKKKTGDYVAASGTLTFRPGERVKEIVISVNGDRTAEPDETFTVELFNAVGAPIADGVATATILNDD
jgi:hypothetical protein